MSYTILLIPLSSFPFTKKSFVLPSKTWLPTHKNSKQLNFIHFYGLNLKIMPTNFFSPAYLIGLIIVLWATHTQNRLSQTSSTLLPATTTSPKCFLLTEPRKIRQNTRFISIVMSFYSVLYSFPQAALFVVVARFTIHEKITEKIANKCVNGKCSLSLIWKWSNWKRKINVRDIFVRNFLCYNNLPPVTFSNPLPNLLQHFKSIFVI